MGRSESTITYSYANGNRFEVCTNNLENPGSILGGSAIVIATVAALRNKELKLDEFEYFVHKNVPEAELSNNGRKSLNFENKIIQKDEVVFEGESISEHGRDTEIYTNKGIKNIVDVARSTIKTLKPHIIKYCSQKTYELICDVLNEQELTDLDIDILIEEGELSKNNSKFDYTEKNFKKKYGLTPKQGQGLYKPQHISKMFAEISKTPTIIQGNYTLKINRNDWMGLYMTISETGQNTINHYLYNDEVFKFHNIYTKIQSGEISLEDLYKEMRIEEDKKAESAFNLRDHAYKNLPPLTLPTVCGMAFINQSTGQETVDIIQYKNYNNINKPNIIDPRNTLEYVIKNQYHKDKFIKIREIIKIYNFEYDKTFNEKPTNLITLDQYINQEIDNKVKLIRRVL
jgi:hypothetical protein